MTNVEEHENEKISYCIYQSYFLKNFFLCKLPYMKDLIKPDKNDKYPIEPYQNPVRLYAVFVISIWFNEVFCVGYLCLLASFSLSLKLLKNVLYVRNEHVKILNQSHVLIP